MGIFHRPGIESHVPWCIGRQISLSTVPPGKSHPTTFAVMFFPAFSTISYTRFIVVLPASQTVYGLRHRLTLLPHLSLPPNYFLQTIYSTRLWSLHRCWVCHHSSVIDPQGSPFPTTNFPSTSLSQPFYFLHCSVLWKCYMKDCKTYLTWSKPFQLIWQHHRILSMWIRKCTIEWWSKDSSFRQQTCAEWQFYTKPLILVCVFTLQSCLTLVIPWL